MRAGLARLPQQSGRGGLRHVAVEQGRAQRAVGMGADESGQWDFVGARHRDHRHQADHPGRAVRRGIAPCGQRGSAATAAGKGVHRQFPGGQIIAVGFDRAFGQRMPCAGGNGRQRRERIAVRRSRQCLCTPAGIPWRCATGRCHIRNLDHVPVSPFADGIRKRRRRPRLPPRCPGNASGKTGRYGWRGVAI